ncbi:hypothetical protein EVAR_11768_1 [Eumeta japonica]|uniref:Uncharacterized protein n=1 Tax=Eumeta variegata TaxID=151549 RepID=A0A4C1UPE3_EUMVA|nr:hypothetical protein EVAR_11768_1 [Eumeta japonica]
MLQDIWRSGIDWDETIEADAHKKWLKWVNDIKKLASIRIPRCISPGHTEGELHVFVDASEKSYAAAVHWRIKLSEHESAVSLIAGKARVAPLKVISIPRLELKAALLSAQLSLYEDNLVTMMFRWAQRPYMSCAGRGRYRARYSWHRAKMKVPLTEVDVEPAEAEGLTPNHFLIGRSAALPQRATLMTTCSSACKLAHVSAPRRSLLAEVVERILTDSGARRALATLYAARRPRAISC